MTIAEAVAHSGLSAGLLSRRIRAGKIKGERFGQRMWKVDKASLDAYLATPRKPGVPTGTKRPRKHP